MKLTQLAGGSRPIGTVYGYVYHCRLPSVINCYAFFIYAYNCLECQTLQHICAFHMVFINRYIGPEPD